MVVHAPERTRAAVPAPRERAPRRPRHWLWLLAGLVLAYAVPFLLADLAGMPRDGYYAIYAVAVSGFFALWLRLTHQPVRRVLTRNWSWGVALGLACSAPLVLVVLREPSTPHPHGWTFAGAILWRGVFYGAADGVLLSAFPILAVFAAFAARPLRERSRAAVVGIGAAALAASLVFTAVYHLGYPDFRSSKLRKPVAGDVVWSLPTLLTLSPIGSPLAHVGLHVSAVVHTYRTDVFLPPHGAARTLDRPGLQRALDRLVADRTAAPGASAAVVTPKGVWLGGAGLADVDRGRAVSPDDAFRIYSITKTYVATVVLQLVEERKLRLSDTVGELLPGALPPDKSRITVRQLLTHTSGLYDSMSDGLSALMSNAPAFLRSIHDPAVRREVAAIVRRRDPFATFPAKVWVDIAGAEPLYFRPGWGNHYSNPGYVLLGWIAAKVDGKPLGQVLADRIFRPLGLKHTVYDIGPNLPEPYAHGYVLPNSPGSAFFRPTRKPIDASAQTLGIAGASSIVATAEDVARFYGALLSGRLLAPRTLDELMLGESMGIGYIPASCGAAYGHDGGFFNYTSAARASRDGKTVAVLLLNARGPNADRIDDVVQTLFCGS
jgi:D-alanyl-D-alanine carboxypeptidase